jgi:PEP-CTERM motif
MKKLLSVLSVFALAAIAAGTASAGSISTPTGLNPGDQFRIVFLSSTTTQATSSNLSTYDNIVSSDATGYTYGGTSPIWKAIVSNVTTDARDHIGLLSTSLIPLFTVDGTKVSTGNLWSGSLLTAIYRTIHGLAIDVSVWTGTNGSNGKGDEGISRYNYMGDGVTQTARRGGSPEVDGDWAFAGSGDFTQMAHLYGISDVLDVPATVPEPSTVMLVGLGGLAALAYSFKRKRNSCRR